MASLEIEDNFGEGNALIRLTRDQVWVIICGIDYEETADEWIDFFNDLYLTMDKDEKVEISAKKVLDS